MQSAKGIIGIENSIAVFAAQVIFHIFACERSSAADDREIKLLGVQVLQHILHFQRGLHQQPAQPNGICLMLLRGSDDSIRRLLDAEVHHAVSVVAQDDVYQVLPDVVHIALHRGQNNSSLLRATFHFFHLWLKVGHRLLHHRGGIEYRRQLHLAGAKELAHSLHAVEQNVVDDLERGIFFQCRFQYLL